MACPLIQNWDVFLGVIAILVIPGFLLFGVLWDRFDPGKDDE